METFKDAGASFTFFHAMNTVACYTSDYKLNSNQIRLLKLMCYFLSYSLYSHVPEVLECQLFKIIFHLHFYIPKSYICLVLLSLAIK